MTGNTRRLNISTVSAGANDAIDDIDADGSFGSHRSFFQSSIKTPQEFQYIAKSLGIWFENSCESK
jgi:hypothetical protein